MDEVEEFRATMRARQAEVEEAESPPRCQLDPIAAMTAAIHALTTCRTLY